MQVTENLIQRFFDQQCNADEADTVASYLYNHPEEMERWLGPDWKQAGKEIPIPALYRKEIWNGVRNEISIIVSPGIGQWKAYMTAAAAILVILSGLWYFLLHNHAAVQQTSLAMQQPVQMELRTNTTTTTIDIHLPDGSLVKLEPGSTLRYAKKFIGTERKIILNGNGFFDVKKDVAKPFVVAAGDIITTALGTSFRVTENEEGVTVKLYTGKVVVNKEGFDKHWSGPVYLLPGTAMTYSKKQARTTVAALIPETKAIKTPERSTTQKKMQLAETELIFDNTPLLQVLTQMEERFAIKIKYDQSVINNHYFTGKILPTDSAELLLNVIGNMNGLTIKKEANNLFLLVKNQ